VINLPPRNRSGRFNEAMVHGHIRSIVKSGKVNGRTTMNLAFDSIDLPDDKHPVLHGYVTKVMAADGNVDKKAAYNQRVAQPDAQARGHRRTAARSSAESPVVAKARLSADSRGAGGAGSLAINAAKIEA